MVRSCARPPPSATPARACATPPSASFAFLRGIYAKPVPREGGAGAWQADTRACARAAGNFFASGASDASGEL
jgi:hypothetical protein